MRIASRPILGGASAMAPPAASRSHPARGAVAPDLPGKPSGDRAIADTCKSPAFPGEFLTLLDTVSACNSPAFAAGARALLETAGACKSPAFGGIPTPLETAAPANHPHLPAPSRTYLNLRHPANGAPARPAPAPPHSHSIVPGGFEVMSYTTRLIPRTSLMMRVATLPRKSCGNGK
jgi:hypothetical protein